VYKEIWNAELDLACEREVGNQSNAFAVAMKKDSVNSGSCTSSHFTYLFNIYMMKQDNQVQGYWN